MSEGTRNPPIRNDRGLTFRQVVKLMGSTPPPPEKTEAKGRAAEKRRMVAEERAKYEAEGDQEMHDEEPEDSEPE